MTQAQTETWTDMMEHPLITKRDSEPLIETRVSKTMAVTREVAYDHFFGSQPELRLDLHKDHVKAYHIHEETDSTLEYEYVFEAYGTRNWGKAAEVGDKPRRIDVEVKAGPLVGQTVTTLFDELPPLADGTPQTKVTQINRVWPGDADMTVRLMGKKLKSQLAALAGVHLEQHRVDMETDGQERFQDRFSQQHQAEVDEKTANPVKDFLATTRAVTLPIIWFPILAGAAIAAQQGSFDLLALALTLIGGGAALMGANLLNDLYDFGGGADQAARTVPGQIETGSGAFTEGRWSHKKGWGITAALFAVAGACGAYLAWAVTPQVLVWAAVGGAISYLYVGPPFPLAYKGRGLGEGAIFVAFGIAPVVGAVLAHGGTYTPQVGWVAAVFGLTSSVVLYHHHFLHWQADKLAGKGSPVAMLGPEKGAAVGFLFVAATVAAIAAAAGQGHLPAWSFLAAAAMVLLIPAQRRVADGDTEPPARVKLATAGFFAMLLSNLALVITLFLA
ncbi:MAG: prenyltransferase [Thermoplasmatota archaeon]